MKPKILVLERIHKAGLEALAEFAFVKELYGESRQAVLAAAAASDAIVVKSRTAVDADFLDAAPSMAVVARAGTGTENIDLPACAARKVKVVTTPSSNIVATAELTIAMMLTLCRNLPQMLAAVQAGDFRRHLCEGRELSGLKVGLLGLGNVAFATAERLRGFGAVTAAWSPSNRRRAEFEKIGVEVMDSLDALLRHSELLSLHARLTPESRHMLDARRLRLLPPGAFLVNTARGGLIDDQALLAALDDNHLAAAVVDVLDPEPPFDQLSPTSYAHPFLDHPRILVTPHAGASTQEAQRRTGLQVAEGLRAHFAAVPEFENVRIGGSFESSC